MLSAIALPWGVRANPPEPAQPASPQAQLAELERAAGGRLGVFVIDTTNAHRIGHRAEERFPFCSTFKLMLAGAVLARSVHDLGLLSRLVHYRQADLAAYSPICEQHVKQGMTVAALCQATLQYSDNTATNLLLKRVGGPAGLTGFARAIGNPDFRLDRIEPALNSALPGDERDTASPVSMALSLKALSLGDALPTAQRKRLNQWLLGNTTGDKRIRAGLPAGWQVGDKTGSGHYGTTNDLGVLWPPQREPLVLAVYYTQDQEDAKWRDDVIAAATRIVVQSLGG